MPIKTGLIKTIRVKQPRLDMKYLLKVTLFIFVSVFSVQSAWAESVDERMRAAGLPATKSAELLKYAKDEDWRVREVVAKRQSTPGDILILLAKDPSWRVRAALAHNLRAPKAAIIPLVNDSSADVRFSVAHCGYTPSDLIVKLLNDPDFKVRNQAVVNLNVPLNVLKEVAAGSSDIADTAKAALEKRLADGER